MTRIPEQPGIPRSMLQSKVSARASGEVASPHRAGHSSGLHPEDQPYQSDDFREQRRATTRRPAPIQVDDEYVEEHEIDTGYDDPPHVPSSVRRYGSVQPAYPRSVVRVQYYNSEIPLRASRTQTQDYQTTAPAPEPQPEPRTTPQRKRPRSFPRIHWTWYVGAALFLMLLGWQGLSALSQLIQVKEDDAHYGYPRTYQTDAVVGHNDSPLHPSHFIVLNLSGRIYIYELPGGNGTKTRIYTGPTLYEPGGDLTPVTVKFQDTTGKGLPDMILIVGTEHFDYHNTGTSFVPPKPNQ